MKQTIIFLFVILHCLFRVHASSHPSIGDFSLSTTRFYQKGDSIFLQCRITGNAPIGKWQSYVVDCCLRKNDSLDRLDSFLLSGRYHYIHSQRKKQKKSKCINGSEIILQFSITHHFRTQNRCVERRPCFIFTNQMNAAIHLPFQVLCLPKKCVWNDFLFRLHTKCILKKRENRRGGEKRRIHKEQNKPLTGQHSEEKTR